MSCHVHVGADLPVKTTVSVTKQVDWIVSTNPILLKNDADEVCWDVGAVVQDFIDQGKQVNDIEIRFFDGPLGYDPQKGPFQNPPIFDNQSKKLTVIGRNDQYGDCYCYNIWVWTQGHTVSAGSFEALFPIDPQVDNLMPPIPPSAPWLLRLWRLWRRLWLAIWRAILAMLRRRP